MAVKFWGWLSALAVLMAGCGARLALRSDIVAPSRAVGNPTRYHYPTLPPAWTATPIPTRTPLRPTVTHLPLPSPTADLVWPTATLVAPPTTWPPATLAPFFATPRARAWNQRIIVSLSLQMLFAYEGETLLHIAPVSTGAEATPTVAGDFAIYLRRASQRMRGLGYDYDRVPYVQYFYQDYALHAAYWHNSFGRPVSHGCVNLSVPEAEWLYHWARVGTVVQVVP